MSQAHLLIKYQNSLICEKVNNRLDFINVPPYSHSSSFSNISVLVSLLTNGLIDKNFNSTKSQNFYEWSDVFDKFIPDYLFELDEDTYIYDLDELLKDDPELNDQFFDMLEKMPANLTIRSIASLYAIYLESQIPEKDVYFPEELPYTYFYGLNKEYLSLKLSKWVKFIYNKRTDKDVLLMYSGGKDSTLSAIRLHNAGYNVHFIHFNNGYMRDSDKPFLTYTKTFKPEDGYYFSYLHKSVDVSHLVRNYQERYTISDLHDISLESEYCCLSCRMAMYTEALRIAYHEGYKYLAEGARASQEFMLEQPEFLEHLKRLAASYGIELLFPVLHLTDDQEEIHEIIDNGYSSKTWESKCLIGRSAVPKTEEDKEAIISYYSNKLEPTMKKMISYPKK